MAGIDHSLLGSICHRLPGWWGISAVLERLFLSRKPIVFYPEFPGEKLSPTACALLPSHQKHDKSYSGNKTADMGEIGYSAAL